MSEATDVARGLEEAWASGDYDAVRSVVAEDLVDHSPHLGEWTGVDNAIQNDEASGRSFPDRKRTVEDIFGEGDKAVVRCRFRATNKGGLPQFGVPANGNAVDFQWINIYRVAGGKVVERWAQMDLATLMQQLGAMPG